MEITRKRLHDPRAKDRRSTSPETVRIDPLFQAPEPARIAGAQVTFEPGARTAWHTHPLGQTLIVTSGCGLVSARRWYRRGDSGRAIVVWFSTRRAGTGHGATSTTAMTHIASSGIPRRHHRHVVGTGYRRAIPHVDQ